MGFGKFLWLEDDDLLERVKSEDFIVAESLKAMHKALNANLPVSKGFFIPSSCIKELIRDLVSNLEKNEENFLEVVREKIKEMKTPSWFSSEIKENYSKFGIFDYEDAKSLDDAVVNMITAPRGDKKVVVRALFPKIGCSIFDPIYNVHGDKGVEEKILSLISQAFCESSQNILGKMNMGNTEFGILVQEWHPCEKSVVASNFDPLSGEKMFVIEASPGIPLGIYRGLVSPELHVIDKGEGFKEKLPGEGSVAFYNSNDGQEGVNPKPIEFGENVLSESDLEKIIELLSKLNGILGTNYVVELAISGNRIRITNILAGFNMDKKELSVKTHPYVLSSPADKINVNGVVKTISQASEEEDDFNNEHYYGFSILFSETGNIDVLSHTSKFINSIAFRNAGRFSSVSFICRYLNIPCFSLHYSEDSFKSKFVPGQEVSMIIEKHQSFEGETEEEKINAESSAPEKRFSENDGYGNETVKMERTTHLNFHTSSPIQEESKKEMKNVVHPVFPLPITYKSNQESKSSLFSFEDLIDVGLILETPCIIQGLQDVKSVFTNAHFLRANANTLKDKRDVFVFVRDIYEAEDIRDCGLGNIKMVVPFPTDIKTCSLKKKWILIEDIIQMFALETLQQKGVEGAIIDVNGMVKNLRTQSQQVCFEKALAVALEKIPEKMKIGIVLPSPIKEKGLEKLISVFPDYIFVDPKEYRGVKEKMEEVVKKSIRMVFRRECSRGK